MSRRTNAEAAASFKSRGEEIKAQAASPSDADITTELDRQARRFMCEDERVAFETCCTKANNTEAATCEALSSLFEACVIDRTSASKVLEYRANLATALHSQQTKRERSKEMGNATRLHFA